MKPVVSVLAAALTLGACAAAQAAEPVKVMIVGVFHMSNPGQDLHNMKVEDVLLPKPQAQIAAVVKGVGRFKPTLVATEWPKDLVEERWAKYSAGTLPPSRNEVVQLGFGLAKATGARVVGVDVDGDFPYGPVEDYAKAHGGASILEDANAAIAAKVKDEGRRLAAEGIAGALRHMNDPKEIARGNDFYRSTLRIGSGDVQPGVDLLTGWYRRNFLICANIIQLSKPGDRIVVFYGAGHSFLLRQCIQETPGFELVEPNAFLPG
jgi:uncharacterized protein DUF5694